MSVHAHVYMRLVNVGVPLADCGMEWLESGWWSLSGIQPGQGLLCDGTVRADEADRRNKASSAGPLLLPLDDEIYVAIRGITTQSINSDQTTT